MSEGGSRAGDAGAAARPGLERALERACTWLAVGGGVVMLAFTAVSVGSILSRTFLGSPLVGDFELTERGTAIAVFAMLPYCHLRGGNVVVDMFVGMFPAAVRRALAVLGEVLFAIVAALMTWRLALGGINQYDFNDMSMMLLIPTWWMFVPIVASMALLTLVCVARAARGGGEFR
ncbi:MAG TPA: TRAP transporter small permease [Burkholderiaceae bacterium]|nr:TRAP transporter small permease [Burkholderiaceae bacterium]